jgi:hypothetical protein
MSILADSEFAGLRAELEITLTHTCTVTPITAGAEDAEDDEGNKAPTPGTPVIGVPCRYETIQRAVRDEGGVTLATVPSLTVSPTAPIAVGFQVSAITDQLGAVLLAGPARVERVLDDTAGLGAALLPVYELRAGTAGL